MQKLVIRSLAENWAVGKREQLVFEQFVQELKKDGHLGIEERLQEIRHSPRIQATYAATYESLYSTLSSVLGEMPLDQAERLIQSIKPDTGEPN